MAETDRQDEPEARRGGMLSHPLRAVATANTHVSSSLVHPGLGLSGSITPACRMSVPTGVPVARSAPVHPPVELRPIPVIGFGSTGLGVVVVGSPAAGTDPDGERAHRCRRAQVGLQRGPTRMAWVAGSRCSG